MPVRFESPPPEGRLKHKGQTPPKHRSQHAISPTIGQHVQGASEYKQSFQDTHAAQQPKPVAGLRSQELANLQEPPLQRRKKPLEPECTSTTYFDPAGRGNDEYILLGDQSKFAPSIKYPVHGRSKENGHPTAQPKRPVEKVASRDGSDKRLTKASAALKSKKAPYSSNELANAKDDTALKNGKGSKKLNLKNTAAPSPTKDASTSTSDEIVNYFPESLVSQNGAVENGGPPTAERSPPPAPRPSKNLPMKSHSDMARPTKPTIRHPTQAPKKAPEKKRPERKEPVEEARRPVDPREKRTGKMNEFVQTDIPRGVADSGQEAPPDYAMKFRAGIPPPRSRGPKRLSEYQMQFQWKKGVASSPLLAAEQIIYNSNTQLAPYSKPVIMPKMSEYNTAFKKWNLKPVAENKTDEQTPSKKAKMQRSKSLEAVSQPAVKSNTAFKEKKSPELDPTLSPDRLRAAGAMTGMRSEEDKRLLKTSSNPAKIFFPHGKTKNVSSEYASNFNAPSQYAYQHGTWLGADPPHVQPQKTPEPKAAEAEDANPSLVPKASWYSEVVELRRKADEYKQRARGTHFSREHLAQLYAQQANLWDTVSNSSTLSALSLESAGALARKRSSASTSEASQPVDRPRPVARKLAWDGHKKDKEPGSDKTSSRSKSTSTASIAGSDVASDNTLVGSEGSEEGRIPTPQFRTKAKPTSSHRHHLDRTTPAVGGALLTSPPRHKATGVTQSDLAVNKVPYRGPKVSASWAGPSPTYGMPTRDTHVLVDEEAATDQPLPTKFTLSPSAKQEHRPGVNIMPTLRETLREMDTSTEPAKDDDILSLSARSVASSCSLASEVLERARNRRDEFWGKTKVKAVGRA